MQRTGGTGTTIDLLILYSQNALMKMGPIDPSPFVANLVADMNQSFVNGGVDGHVRVVGYKNVNAFSETHVAGEDAWYEFSKIQSEMISGIDRFIDVPAIRDMYHADTVVLFIDGAITKGPCGISSSRPDQFGASHPNAYIVLSTECAAGDRTFTHEIGHLLAGQHNRSMATGTSYPIKNSYGYLSSSPIFLTIMSDGDAAGNFCGWLIGCPRINRWSSLTQTHNGAPIGATVPHENGETYYSDMVSVLDWSVPMVAAYRSPVGLAVPGTPGTPSHFVCGGTHVTWSVPTGVVGWHEADFSNSAGFTTSWLIYRGAVPRFTTHLTSGQYVRVRGCNANGCGSYATAYIPATLPGCDPL